MATARDIAADEVRHHLYAAVCSGRRHALPQLARRHVLAGTRLGRECLVAAGAVVPPGMVVPDRMAVMGVPGKIARPVKEDELKYMRWLTTHYVELAEKHLAGKFEELRG